MTRAVNAMRHLIGSVLGLCLALLLAGPGNAIAGPTTTTLTLSPSTVYPNQAVSFTATVTGSNPSGMVSIMQGATSLGSYTLSAGRATGTLNFSQVGTVSLQAVFGGDLNNGASNSSNVVLTVQPRVNSTTTVSVSPNPGQAGLATGISATVTGASPTGYVEITAAGVSFGLSPLYGGAAYTSVMLPIGSYAVAAEYKGDVANGTSIATAAVTINKRTVSMSLAPTPYNPGAGQPVTLDVTVNGYQPSDVVTFKDGATVIGTAPVTNGRASLATTFATAGTHSLTASYPGDTNNTSASTAYNIPVGTQWASTTTLTATPNPIGVGRTATLTASVTGKTPTGTVTFKDGATTLGTVALASGSATMSTVFTTVAYHNLTATYSGDSNNLAGTSLAFGETVALNATTTTLGATPSPTLIGQAVTLTASVSGLNPTGNVAFKDGTTTLGTVALSGGNASFSYAFTTAGVHSLTAVYAGDASNATSTSAVFTEVVNPTTTTLSVSPTSLITGQSATLTATVTGRSPSGTVSFRDAGTLIGTAALSGGVATYTRNFATGGVHPITAVYGGDAANSTSTSSGTDLTVQKATTTTVVSSSASPAYVGQSVTLTANITGYSAGGTVNFLDGATSLGSAIASAGRATLALPAGFTANPGSHSLTANYIGDENNFASSASAIALNVIPKVNSSTTIQANPSPAFGGQYVTITATLTGTSPSGTVNFFDGATALGTGVIANGKAAYIASFGTTGQHSLSASYPGDTANNPSASTSLPITVNPKSSSTTTLTVSPTTAVVGQSVSLTAELTGAQPSGTVTFTDGAATLGTITVYNGMAVLITNFSAAGTHNLQATYSGDPGNNGSTSASISATVNGTATSSTTLTATPNPATPGQSVALTARVSGSNPSGTVTFLDGATTLGTGTITSGVATLTTSFAAAGVHSLSARYAGNATNTASTSGDVNLAVGTLGSIPQPGGMTWWYGYDPVGNTTTVVDSNGNRTTLAYDNLARATTVTQPIPAAGQPAPTIGMTYDGRDQLTQVRDPRSLNTNYTVNGLGDVAVTASPDTGTTNASFDAAGNLISSTDARGVTTGYQYDASNRPTRITYASGVATVFEYDGGAAPAPYSIGRLTKITDESGTTNYTYDQYGRVLTKTQVAVGSGRQFDVAYGWGSSGVSAGKLTSITYPSGARVNYAYDATGRLSSINVNPTNANGVGTDLSRTNLLLSSLQYNGANDLLGWTWADSVLYRRTYDTFGRIKTYPLGNPAGTGNAAGSTRTIGYDDGGRITGFTHANGAGTAQPTLDQSFGYDGLDRLVSASVSAVQYGYAYDATGNRTSRTVAGTAYANGIAATSNRLTSVQTPGTSGTVTNTYLHDAAGNLTSDGAASFTYGSRGRASSVTVAAGTLGYLYNGLELRTVKTGPVSVVPGGAAYYVYDEAGQQLGEYDSAGVPVHETIYLNGLPVGVIRQTRTGSGATLNVQSVADFVYSDHLATPRVIARSSDHTIAWRWDGAEAFGATAPNENPNGLGAYKFNQRFPGQSFDAETGAFYNWHRSYSPALGRYVQSDPIGLDGGINTYSYAGGSPVGFVDPDGLAAAGGAIGAGIGGFFGSWGGGAAGAAAGATGGTIVAPGVGTFAVGAIGAAEGYALGGAVGASIGWWIGSAIEDWLFPPSPYEADDEVGGEVCQAADHTKNQRPSNWNKHTKPRPGRDSEKKRHQPGWIPNPNKKK